MLTSFSELLSFVSSNALDETLLLILAGLILSFLLAIKGVSLIITFVQRT